MAGIAILYRLGVQTLAHTLNATIIPRIGDFVVIDNFKFAIKEIIWHLENSTWVEIQVEKA